MPQPKRWLDEVIDVFEDLGGKATLRQVYAKIFERNIMDFAANPSWKDSARKTIYMNSSDCKIFTHHGDIFYAVEGKGKGIWGLREFKEVSENEKAVQEFPEGKEKMQVHLTYERNPKVIKLAKEKRKSENGILDCEVCHFDFEKKYGEIGADYIDGHHIITVSNISEGYNTSIYDIVLLCSNCHKMIHRKRPWITKDELSKLISETEEHNVMNGDLYGTKN